MAEHSLRGMSIGSKSLESDENVELAPRHDYTYVCPDGHKTVISFSDEADMIPGEWECRCGKVAHLENSGETEATDVTKQARSHWDMLLERRTEDELKELLDKRLHMYDEGWFPDYE